MRLRGLKEQPDFGQTLAHVHAGQTECGGVAKTSLAMHPPYQGGTGYVFARYDALPLPASPPAAFRAVVGKGDGSDLGDGILYRLAVVDEHGTETVVAERTVLKHAWLPIEADLSRWAGKRVALKLVADVGPKDNSSGDWACWADMRIESLHPQLRYVLVENTEVCRHVPGPHPVSGLTIEELRRARSGRLRYDGKGLSGTGQYGTFAVLNGAELGHLAPAGGDETKGVFQKNVSVPLTPEAIRSLGRRNRFTLRNPNDDCFSIRRFWIELDLADGRKCSSDISTATYTQPPEWLYAEGISVPGDQDLAVDVWFDVQPVER